MTVLSRTQYGTLDIRGLLRVSSVGILRSCNHSYAKRQPRKLQNSNSTQAPEHRRVNEIKEIRLHRFQFSNAENSVFLFFLTVFCYERAIIKSQTPVPASRMMQGRHQCPEGTGCLGTEMQILFGEDLRQFLREEVVVVGFINISNHISRWLILSSRVCKCISLTFCGES
jgi:hypothetical protein